MAGWLLLTRGWSKPGVDRRRGEVASPHSHILRRATWIGAVRRTSVDARTGPDRAPGGRKSRKSFWAFKTPIHRPTQAESRPGSGTWGVVRPYLALVAGRPRPCECGQRGGLDARLP